jgi:hypothetical protein
MIKNMPDMDGYTVTLDTEFNLYVAVKGNSTLTSNSKRGIRERIRGCIRGHSKKRLVALKNEHDRFTKRIYGCPKPVANIDEDGLRDLVCKFN